jgi:hypothetical protein
MGWTGTNLPTLLVVEKVYFAAFIPAQVTSRIMTVKVKDELQKK